MFHYVLFLLLFVLISVSGCHSPVEKSESAEAVSRMSTRARTGDGRYISWREHIIDDSEIGGARIEGSDGLSLADLDLDGYPDIVSVHESDTTYDGKSRGHIRIAYGTGDPERWELRTLVEGPEAGAAEDVAIGDMNGDGFPDVIAACELAHLIYFQNPGRERSTPWKKHIPKITTNRGSFIRVFLADLTGDGRLEVVSANKGAQNPSFATAEQKPISWFQIAGDPLQDASWKEHELTRVRWPINSQPVDLDGDGDIDVVAGSMGEVRILWFENIPDKKNKNQTTFIEHPISVRGTAITGKRRLVWTKDSERPLVSGFHMDFVDMNGDSRLDIVLAEALQTLVWLEQPSRPASPWKLHEIGSIWPDMLIGLVVADINGDGYPDAMTGGYSQGDRDKDGDVTRNNPLGRLAWFENPGNGDAWKRHDISRRKRGMFDQFVPLDLDEDGDLDFISTRGNSAPYDGVFWLEQVRSQKPQPAFERARQEDSAEMPLPSFESP